jgi:hypothetical protein
MNIKNDKKLKDALINGVIQTFEEMAFIDAKYIENPEDYIEFKQILYIDIIKPLSGKLALYLPYETKKLIAENVYGSELEELNSEEIDDCQLEILNVLVGNFLSFYFGGRKKYKIDLPSILFDENDVVWNKKDTSILYFDAETSIFKIALEL